MLGCDAGVLYGHRDKDLSSTGDEAVRSKPVKSLPFQALLESGGLARRVPLRRRGFGFATHSPMDLRAILFGVVRPWRARVSDSRPRSYALSPDAAFAEGWESLQCEEFIEAERAFRLVLEARPDDADASLYLGIALAGQGSHADAIAPLRAAAEARPLDAEVHWRLGISLRETGELFLAMSSLRQALQLRPGLYEVEAALDDLVSAAARSATRTSPVRGRSLRRAGRRRSHRYIRRTMPASSRELRVGA